MSGGGDYDQIATPYAGAIDVKLATHEAIFTRQRYPWIPNSFPVGGDSDDDSRDSRAGKHFAGNETAAALTVTLIASRRYIDLIGEPADIGELCPGPVGGDQFKVVGEPVG